MLENISLVLVLAAPVALIGNGFEELTIVVPIKSEASTGRALTAVGVVPKFDIVPILLVPSFRMTLPIVFVPAASVSVPAISANRGTA